VPRSVQRAGMFLELTGSRSELVDMLKPLEVTALLLRFTMRPRPPHLGTTHLIMRPKGWKLSYTGVVPDGTGSFIRLTDAEIWWMCGACRVALR
jgi:hypothetical protein